MYKLQFCESFPKSTKKRYTIVFITMSKSQLGALLERIGYDDSYEGSPIHMKNKNDIIMYHLDPNKLYVSLKDIASKIADINNDVCLSLSNVPSRNKLIILNFICKYSYVFDKYISNRENKTLYVRDDMKNKGLIERLLDQISNVNGCRDFENEPANIINPESFCEYANDMLKAVKGANMVVNVYTDDKLKKMGLTMISDMGAGSKVKPRLLEIIYRGQNRKKDAKGKKTICIIGKGVTFDSGGLNIKGTDHMEDMKLDKTGGCTVVALMKYIAKRNIEYDVIGLVPLIENSVSGEALHPGDILKSYKNKSVEIVNTDAEGRIILANAIEYCEKFNPEYIIDIATLTGSSGMFHCDVSAVFYTINEKLKNILEKIGENIGERVVAMPTWPEYQEYVKSDVANVKNLGFECKASTYMAAMFLLKFVPEKLRGRWLHFDVCNVMTNGFVNGNTTLLLMNFLEYMESKK